MYYLDHAAATPLSKRAKLAMEPYLSDDFFNPSSPYLPATKVRDAYESAKDQIASAIGARGTDLIITASATESTNLAFTTLSKSGAWNKGNCVLISTVEHPSVSEVAKNYGNYQTIKVDKHGLIDLKDLAQNITEHTQLISIALATSDLGTIQPIAKVAELVKAERLRRKQSGITTPIYLHSDASAALNLLDVKVARLGVDLLTISSAKIYGPRGVAALWARPSVPLKPLIHGGGQESALRSGTENVPAVIGFATAITEASAGANSAKKRLTSVKSTLKTILEQNPNIIFLGQEKHQLASHLPITIPGLDAERLIYALEKRQVYTSTGAACASNKHQPQSTLEALGLTKAEIAGHLRLTIGRQNTQESIKKAARLILETIAEEQKLQSSQQNTDATMRSVENLLDLPSTIFPPARTATYIPDAPDKVAVDEVRLQSLPERQRMTCQAETGIGEGTVQRFSADKPRVFLGLSGGVDSSLSALLLKNQGYAVTGVYMKNWSRDLPGHKCPWARDLADAKRTAAHLNIPFQVFDLEEDYKQKVVDYMLSEYQKGNTPNPDIMCNSEIKFKVFADLAFAAGADFIATGHYAQTDGQRLLRAADDNKDQTYFLYRTDPKILQKTLFPIGHLKKPAVKKLAAEHNLPSATRKESMGICFVGQVGIRDFLSAYFPENPGEIRDIATDKILGQHDGAIFYTLGQRHGLDLGGGLPYYIVKKDIDSNILYVSRDLNEKSLWVSEIELKDIIIRDHFLAAALPTAKKRTQEERKKGECVPFLERSVLVRLRHRAELIPATLKGATLHFTAPIKRPAPGQSAVFYDKTTCLGGGIIA